MAVMQAYLDGLGIEIKHKMGANFETTEAPGWDWVAYDYRIKKLEPKPGNWYKSISWNRVIKFIGMDGEYFVFRDGEEPWPYEAFKCLPDDIVEVEEPSLIEQLIN